MQEFRPATVIAADTDLARRFAEGDADAVDALVDRYGAALTAAIGDAVDADEAPQVVAEVFVAAHRDPIEPGGDFGPWLADLARERAGSFDERVWAIAMGVGAIEPDVRSALRAHHLGEDAAGLDDTLIRHELRLQRRLAHLADPLPGLADPAVWVEPDPDLAARVLARIGTGVGGGGTNDTVDPLPVDLEAADETGPSSPPSPSRIARGLRPALIGLGAAVVVLFVAIIALSAASGTPESADFTVELTPTGALVDVEGGEITVTERGAGIELELEAFTLPRRAGGLFYEGRVVLDDGREISAGTFAQGDGVTLWAGVALADAEAFRIVLGDLEDGSVDDVVLKADFPAG